MKPVARTFTEPRMDRRKVLMGLLFCSAAGLAAWRQPYKRLDYLGKQKLEDLVPKTVGQWKFVAASGLVVPPNDQMSQALYSQLLTRVYDDGVNPPVMLLIAQSGNQTGVLQVHRPEFCYTAGGYQLAPLATHIIPLGGSRLVTTMMDASLEDRTEHVLYWTRIGDQMPASWRAQKLAVAQQNLEGIIPDAILVRVSTVSEDPRAAQRTLDTFVRALIGSIPTNRHAVFIA